MKIVAFEVKMIGIILSKEDGCFGSYIEVCLLLLKVYFIATYFVM